MLFIGKSTVRLLEHHGIKTIGDIAAEKNKTLLENLLDKN
jgi:nucleotidyltransferase/DNA polymerase involved in DNA repair